MKWKVVRNESYNTRDTYQRGECPKFNETATLFIHLSGEQKSRYDSHPTFTPHIIECSLLKEKGDKNTSCMLSCPVFEAYKNSHDY